MTRSRFAGKKWDHLTLAVALASLTVSLYTTAWVHRTGNKLVELSAGPRPRDEALEQRLQLVSTELNEQRGRLDRLHEHAGGPSEVKSDQATALRAALAQIGARIEQAERQLAAMTPDSSEPQPMPSLSPDALREASNAAVERALDPTLDDTARVQAIESLRTVPAEAVPDDFFSRVGAWLSAVGDESLQTRLARNLRGDRDPAIRDWLLERLEHARDRRLREEAAESLAACHEDPRVRAALLAASRHDSSQAVRAKAARALER